MSASIQTPSKVLSRSSLMRAYNAAVGSRKFDSGRLARALGIAQSHRVTILPDNRIDITSESGTDFYLLTVTADRKVSSCDCRDFIKHDSHFWCKHRIATALIIKAIELECQS